ncbi:paraneoplastic antigen Ma1 [Pimephales promelas]|nr:paraneoplastic antigen Ma1 [Pimephales promelas]
MDADYSSLQAELDDWSQKAIIDQKHAVLLFGVPSDVEVARIEETIQKVKALGRVRVRDSKEGPTPGFLLVLCECKEVVDPSRVPVEVIPEGGETPWKIIVAKSAESPSDGFAEKLAKLLTQEGKSFTDLQAMFSTPSSNAGSPEAIIRAVGELLEKTSKPVSDGGAYRRLRTFSGIVPTPAGEEALESWMDQARMMITECECSEKEKRRRIIESLKGSALDVVKAVRFSSPDATSLQYLEALEGAFGTPESGEDLYFAFRLLRQNPGEALSDFLKRMEKSLTKVAQKGGLPWKNLDQTRVEQLIRGAVESDLMLLQLRLRERRGNPPTFLTLLNEIREAEESEAARHSLGFTVKPVPRPRERQSSLAVVRELKAEIEELRTKVAEGSSKVTMPEVMMEPKPIPRKRGGDTSGDSEVLSLRKQVQRLEEQLASLSIRQSPQMTRDPHSLEQADTSVKPRFEKAQEDYFCYKCGEDGHIAPKCKAPENYCLVIQKLVRSLRKARNERMDQSSSKHTSDKASFSRKSQTVAVEKSSLPEGLVGPALTITMKINGQPCEALLDSGSQVTIIFEPWYSENLSSVPIQPLSGLSIWGLSTASYPYKGYVLVDVSFPASVMGVEETVSILALVCPEPEGPKQVPAIIGTNASFFQRLTGLGTAGHETDEAHSLRIQLHNSELESRAKLDIPAGEVKWTGPGACVIPSRGEMCAVCTVESQKPLEKEIFMVETPSDDMLPAGLFILPVVLPSSAVEENKFKVLIKNETCKEVTIPSGTVVAHVFPTDTVTVASVTPVESKTINPKVFDFNKSTIPKEWEDRLRQKLSVRGNVFSQEEWDVGLAKDVKHCIRLSDSRPFRERSRRIAPADIDDVRRHLKDLLAAGIIKESRSPYASPIVIVRKKSGAIRMCIDYRTLNSRTLPDQYTTPRIDDALDCLAGSKWFSVLDLRSGYYQIAMADEDKEKTAFICPLGFYEFERMPQGVSGAPATFQRLMERAVGDMHLLELELGNLKQLTHAELQFAQDKDPVIGPVKIAVEQGKVLTPSASANLRMTLLLRQSSKLVCQNKLLYRVSISPCGKEKKQLVLPEQFHQQVMYSLHDDAGHLGIERTTELLKDRFYWPQMTSEIEKYVKNCGRCITRKTLPQKRAPLSNITSSGPMELICIDFLSIEPDSKGLADVLVVTDHFTRYSQAYPTKDQKAVTVAKILWEKFFVYYGLPARIHSDQGRDFESRLIKELLGMLGIKNFTGKHKLEDKWNSAPYIVLEKLDNLPVYRLKSEKETGGVRTMHRDHLLPIGQSVRMPKPDKKQEVPQRPVTRSRATKEHKETLREERVLGPPVTADNSSGDEDGSDGYYFPDRSKQWTQLIPDLQHKLEVQENEVTAHTDSESQYSGEEEVVEETCENEDSRENRHPIVDLREEESLEGGVDSSDNASDLQSEPMEHRPKRKLKPVFKLSYDELGKSSERPVTVVHRGIVIHLTDSSKIELCPSEKYQHLPKCARCTRICGNSENTLIIHS